MPERFGAVYGGFHGVEGVLKEELLDLSAQDPREIALLRTTPAAGAIGTCRYKLEDSQQLRARNICTRALGRLLKVKDDKVEESGSSFKDGLLASLSSWGPSAGLGLLALLALGLVWNVVKKIQPVAAPPETVTVGAAR